MSSSGDDVEPVQACTEMTQHGNRDRNKRCTGGCSKRIIGTKGSCPTATGRSCRPCFEAAVPRSPSRKKRRLRPPSPPAPHRERPPRNQNATATAAASAMVTLSAVVATKNSHSDTVVEPELASTSGFASAVAAAAGSPASSALPHSKYSEPLKSRALLEEPAHMMSAYGYALIGASVKSIEMAEKIQSLDVSRLMREDRPNQFSVISGGVSQFNLASVPALFTREDKTMLDAIIADAFGQCGLSDQTCTLHRVATKLLEAAPGEGEQVPHFDQTDAWTAVDRFSAILICSSGTDTTAMPRYCAPSEFPWKSVDDVASRDLQKVCHLLEPEWYHRVRATKGQVLIFPESIPHHGTCNTREAGNRRVLFSMWSPEKRTDQDEYQMYPWMVNAQAYGADSIETAQSLVSNARHQPLDRMDPISRREYAHCLTKHRLRQAYDIASKPFKQ
jgi:hypothetical protein